LPQNLLETTFDALSQFNAGREVYENTVSSWWKSEPFQPTLLATREHEPPHHRAMSMLGSHGSGCGVIHA